MFDPFVVGVVALHGAIIERIGRVVYRWNDATLTIYLRGQSEALHWLAGEEAMFRTRARAEGVEFVDRVVRQFFRHAGWTDMDIERADIGDEEDVPPAVRCTTTWFLK